MACPNQCNTCPPTERVPQLVQNPPCPGVTCCPPGCVAPRRMCRYIQPPRPISYKPEIAYRPPMLKMDDDTIYRKSYLPVDGDKPVPIRPPHNLCIGQGRISDDTIHRLSYMGHAVPPPCPIIPCEHKMIGEGPMQIVTTNRHDYVPKPFCRMQPCYPAKNLFTSDCPLSDLTTNRLSYLPLNVDNFKVHAIKQEDAMDKPCGMLIVIVH